MFYVNWLYSSRSYLMRWWFLFQNPKVKTETGLYYLLNNLSFFANCILRHAKELMRISNNAISYILTLQPLYAFWPKKSKNLYMYYLYLSFEKKDILLHVLNFIYCLCKCKNFCLKIKFPTPRMIFSLSFLANVQILLELLLSFYILVYYLSKQVC